MLEISFSSFIILFSSTNAIFEEFGLLSLKNGWTLLQKSLFSDIYLFDVQTIKIFFLSFT